jgi:acetyltransferase-like isoleucine patch superfamily enzyme
MKRIHSILSELKLYICNKIIAHVPSRRCRLFFYRKIMKFNLGVNTSIFMGTTFTTSGNIVTNGQVAINACCHIDNRGGIEIGKNVSISQGVSLVTGDHDVYDPLVRARFRKITIENDVFIGFNAIILGGVTLGRGSVVAAGSVVTKNVPDLTIVGGIPAKSIGQRPDDIKRDVIYSRFLG